MLDSKHGLPHCRERGGHARQIRGEGLRGRDDMRKPGKLYKAAVIAMHALVGWAYCGVLIGVGRRLLPMHTTLIGAGAERSSAARQSAPPRRCSTNTHHACLEPAFQTRTIAIHCTLIRLEPGPVPLIPRCAFPDRRASICASSRPISNSCHKKREVAPLIVRCLQTCPCPCQIADS